jgi:hypothetical protein
MYTNSKKRVIYYNVIFERQIITHGTLGFSIKTFAFVRTFFRTFHAVTSIVFPYIRRD